MKKNLKISIIMALILMLIFNISLSATSFSSAQAVAMGGAFMSLAKGVDAAKYNPANLGFYTYQRNSIELVGVSVRVNNNSFSLDDYNRYTGSFLTNEDKEIILGKIPTEGLAFSADVSASAMSIAIGPFAFTTEAIGIADVNLSKEIVNFVLNGNTFGDTIEVNGSFSNAIAYGAAGMSYGFSIYNYGTRQVSLGTTVKYIKGLGIEEIIELEGLATTYEDGFAGEGHLLARTSTGGSGYTVDVGAAIKFSNKYTAGITIKNFNSKINWSKDTEHHNYDYNFKNLTIENMNNDSASSNNDTEAINSFSSSLPSVLTVGIAKTYGSLLWAIDWEQGFTQTAGASSEPRISLGLEWSPLSVFPLRAGFSSGGRKNTAFSFGSGIDLNYYYLDFAFISGASLSTYSTKGLNIAISTGLRF